jgi:preprotein translocase subunit YajC
MRAGQNQMVCSLFLELSACIFYFCKPQKRKNMILKEQLKELAERRDALRRHL